MSLETGAPEGSPIGGVLIERGGAPGQFESERGTPAIGPYRVALRRLRRNKTALFFLGVFILIVAACLLAPVYSRDVAHIGPNITNVTGTINVNGHQTNVVSVDGLPIGPQWSFSHYFFGADLE